MVDASELREKSDMTNWFSRLRGTGVPVPYTRRVAVDELVLDEGTINELTVAAPNLDDLRKATREVGGPRAFVRTSQASDKHSLASASRIDYLNDRHLDSTRSALASAMKMKMGVPEAEAWYVREWLDLEHQFTAFGELPIAQELRVFIHEGEIHDVGFYWPHDAIRRASVEDWPDMLTDTRERALDERDRVESLAEVVADEFTDGYWSVDLAKATDGVWYCIDMARGELSWHPEECEPPAEVLN